MEKILDAFMAVLKDWLTLVLAGLGITFANHVYLGGMFLAFAGAAVSRAWEREQAIKAGHEVKPESNSIFLTVIVTAFLVSTVVGVISHQYFPTAPVQLAMAAAGFASRKIIVVFLGATDTLASRGDRMTQKVINRFLPEDKSDSDSKSGNQKENV